LKEVLIYDFFFSKEIAPLNPHLQKKKKKIQIFIIIKMHVAHPLIQIWVYTDEPWPLGHILWVFSWSHPKSGVPIGSLAPPHPWSLV
jgi:hypothetical protein